MISLRYIDNFEADELNVFGHSVMSDPLQSHVL